jgi:hypothetical protein
MPRFFPSERIRKKQEPLVFNVMRKIAMVLFKQNNTKLASIAFKKRIAGLDNDYRLTCNVRG